MNTCPVYRRSGGHSYAATVPGPIGSILGPASDAKEHSSLPFACSLCGSCTDVCPVKIDLHQQLLTWRREIYVKGYLPLSKTLPIKLAAKVFKHPGLYRFLGKLARMGLKITPRFLKYNPLNSWGRQRDLPDPPDESFRAAYRNRQREKEGKK